MTDINTAADMLITRCMAAKSGETVLVVDDDRLNTISSALIGAADRIGCEPIRMTMKPRERSGQEPPEPVSAAMRSASVVLMPTNWSLSHTKARHAACDAGARVASMPGITEEMFVRTMSADYNRVAERSRYVAGILAKGSEAVITTSLGTNLRLNLQGRPAMPDTGLYHTPGDFGNLPAGEAYIAPMEGFGEGVLVVDASMAGLGVLNSPITFTIRDGRVVDAEGEGSDQLKASWKAVGDEATWIAELGVGTNDAACVIGKVLEDEKVMGTIHVAFGNNAHFGGTNNVPYHADGIVTKATLIVDGTPVITDGIPAF